MRKYLVLVIALVAGACGGNSGSADVDAAVHGTVDAAPPTCQNKVTTVGNGHHNPGQDCLNSCHNHGFTAAGTLYSSGTGSTPVVGATITLVDAHGVVANAISQTNGNFYTSVALTYPISVYASSCPSLTAMTNTITQTQGGGCNQGGACHGGTQGHIHLP